MRFAVLSVLVPKIIATFPDTKFIFIDVDGVDSGKVFEINVDRAGVPVYWTLNQIWKENSDVVTSLP